MKERSLPVRTLLGIIKGIGHIAVVAAQTLSAMGGARPFDEPQKPKPPDYRP